MNRNKNLFFCRGLQTQKKVIHILAYKEFADPCYYSVCLMRGLCINIQIFWVSFLWAHFLVEKFCGELKKQLEQPFPPFSENIFTGALSSLSYESYTKKEKKAWPHEDKGENGYGIW